ncbi:MAG: ABC transporter permease [Bacilli bacterium]|nr:ABC transporter permease [Bacilli bacterium]
MINIDKLPVEYRPISPIAYFGYAWLFSIPLIGLVFTIVYALSNANINRRNFARAFLIVDAVILILAVIFGLAGGYVYIISLFGGVK